MSPTRQRLLPFLAIIATASVLSPVPAAAETYGRLIVRHNATPTGALDTNFGQVRAPRAFMLVVTEPKGETLSFNWSVHCVGSGPKESGGASGRAIVSS